MADREQLFPLGLFFSYNNAGFTLLGGILEAVTGRPMEELLRSLIVEPLGLTHVCFNAAEVITHDFAVGHHALPDGTAVARPWRLPRSVLPMGGIVTNAGDLLRYARCCLNRGRTETGKRMLKAQSVDRMHRAKAVISSEDRTSVGYSWMRRDLTKGCVLWHNGATNGQTARLTLLPERDFALSILTNGDRGGTLITEIERHILASYLQVTVESPREIDSTPQQLARYAGTAERPGSVFSMGMLGHHLVGAIENTFGFPTENDPPLPPSPPFRVGRCGADRLIILDGNAKGLPIDIYRNPEGDIASLRMGRMYRFTRSE